jgi:ribonuclease BN (tRNA processing enzyme)
MLVSTVRSRTTLRFIGVSNCLPDAGQETACVLLNESVLVDAGWHAALHMRRFGCDPLAVSHVFLTHCHHDHYLGLAPLFFYRAMKAKEGASCPPLVIAGPHIEMERVIEGARQFLQAERYPDAALPLGVVHLRPGESYDAGRLRVRTAQTVHPTLSVCYRFEDTATGAVVVVTGDTAYYEPLGRFAAGADVLVHEASAGPGSRDPLEAWGHSGAQDAARIAQAARPKRLYIVHFSEAQREADLNAARLIFPETYAPREGEAVELPLA